MCFTLAVLVPNRFADHKLVGRLPLDRTVMDRLRHVCHTEDRKVLVSIDRLDLCKVGPVVDICSLLLA